MLAGEVVWAVPPLELPGTAAPGRPDDLAQFSAVQLFVRRASASAPGFRLDAGNAWAVAALCRRLDGIPLALELAATRVRALGVHELLGGQATEHLRGRLGRYVQVAIQRRGLRRRAAVGHRPQRQQVVLRGVRYSGPGWVVVPPTHDARL